MSPQEGRRAVWRYAPHVALLAVTLLVYGNTLANGFVWDDDPIIVSNPITRDPSAMGRVLLSPDETPPYYRPLNRASYLVDHALFGMEPRGFHAVNVAIHAAGVLALYALARRLFSTRTPAFVAALLLAVHPLHAESVNFVTARNNLFALLFSLLSVLFMVDAARSGSRRRALASGVAFFLALASKEQGAMALPFMLAWVFVPRAFARDAVNEPAVTRLRLFVPHAVALGIYLGLRAYSLGGIGGGDPGAAPEGLLSRLALNWYTVPRYLALVVFPRDLTIFHVVPRGNPFSPAWLPLAWAAIAAVVAAVVRRPTLASTAGLAWVGFNLLPIANIVPIPSAVFAERFFHAAAAGAWLLAADGVARAERRLPRGAVIAAVAVVAVALAARTFDRNRDWRDDVALAASAVEVNPDSVRGRFNLGNALKDRGNLDAARAHWEAALAVDPGDAETLAQLGTFHAIAGDLARAETLLRRAIASERAPAMAHLNLARILERTGRAAEATAEYEAFLRTATRLDEASVPLARARLEELRRALGR